MERISVTAYGKTSEVTVDLHHAPDGIADALRTLAKVCIDVIVIARKKEGTSA